MKTIQDYVTEYTKHLEGYYGAEYKPGVATFFGSWTDEDNEKRPTEKARADFARELLDLCEQGLENMRQQTYEQWDTVIEWDGQLMASAVTPVTFRIGFEDDPIGVKCSCWGVTLARRYVVKQPQNA